MGIHQAVIQAKRALATPLMRRIMRRPDHRAVRAEIASKYLRGDGLEIGALNTPLELPAAARVQYVDRAPLERLPYRDFEGEACAPDIISDVQTLSGISDESADFVVANHVLEHVENPLGALNAIGRVLRCGGVAFISLPDKRYSFDRRRQITPLSHIVRDLRDGPDWSRLAHYRDWARNVERLSAHVAEVRAQALYRDRADIHFHVWDDETMARMFRALPSLCEHALQVCDRRRTRGDAVWILRKS